MKLWGQPGGLWWRTAYKAVTSLVRPWQKSPQWLGYTHSAQVHNIGLAGVRHAECHGRKETKQKRQACSPLAAAAAVGRVIQQLPGLDRLLGSDQIADQRRSRRDLQQFGIAVKNHLHGVYSHQLCPHIRGARDVCSQVPETVTPSTNSIHWVHLASDRSVTAGCACAFLIQDPKADDDRGVAGFSKKNEPLFGLRAEPKMKTMKKL